MSPGTRVEVIVNKKIPALSENGTSVVQLTARILPELLRAVKK
jgi:hypothetical protein